MLIMTTWPRQRRDGFANRHDSGFQEGAACGRRLKMAKMSRRLSILKARLEAQHWFKRHPEILQEEIVAPLKTSAITPRPPRPAVR
jgi:hypothetical protein